MSQNPAGAYAGDVSAGEAWEGLVGSPDAALIDVRSKAEWVYVGVPVVSSIGKKTILIEWDDFTTGTIVPDFIGRILCGEGRRLALDQSPRIEHVHNLSPVVVTKQLQKSLARPAELSLVLQAVQELPARIGQLASVEFHFPQQTAMLEILQAATDCGCAHLKSELVEPVVESAATERPATISNVGKYRINDLVLFRRCHNS